MPARVDSDEPPRIRVSTVEWSPEVELGLAEWLSQGRRIGVTGRSAGWWIGDWLRYGNARFGERYSRAARVTGYDVQTLMNMVYVASRFDSSRRREILSWSHHAELAALDPETQDHWLEKAIEERLSVRDLRLEVRAGRHAAARAERELDETVAEVGAEADDDGAGDTGDEAYVDEPRPIQCPNCGHRFEARTTDSELMHDQPA